MSEGTPLTVALTYDGKLAPDSGVSSYIRTIGNYMTERGHDVHYIVAESNIADERIHAIGKTITLHTNGTTSKQSFPVSKTKIRHVLSDIQPDVVHVQMPYNPFLSGRIINELEPGTGLVGTFHSLPKSWFAMYSARWISQLTFGTTGKFDQVFSGSPALQNHALGTFCVDSELLPLPVDIETLKKGRKLPQYEDRLNLLYFGRLEPRKGCHQLIDIMGHLSPTILDKIKLIIAGDGPEKDKLMQQVYDKSLESVVEFTGAITEKDKPNILASSDIAIFPALGGESFGLVVAEALATTSGIVIGGNNSGYRFALGNNPDVLFDPSNVGSATSFLAGLILDHDKRLSIRESQQRLVENYDLEIVGQRTEEAYYSSIENPNN